MQFLLVLSKHGELGDLQLHVDQLQKLADIAQELLADALARTVDGNVDSRTGENEARNKPARVVEGEARGGSERWVREVVRCECADICPQAWGTTTTTTTTHMETLTVLPKRRGVDIRISWARQSQPLISRIRLWARSKLPGGSSL